ncbi:ComEC/Rec2 family competence protein [Carnobacterium divergens]|uniref:ComEC/Rec2 family competence protein n=1 Tax=Carnobacterium divergens TaxID=2748 RepID=UPI002890B721|nr:ComEC/Rec2 family competence protein [Carnobacterium divergens]MDT2010507.1 MBL fold metallo-hydrolase [Carnobacterium divergens]
MATKRKKNKKLTKKQRFQLKASFVLLAMILCIMIGVVIGRNTDPNASLVDKVVQLPNELKEMILKETEYQPVEVPKKESTISNENAIFRFLDIGQGDATLIQASDGTTILIDTGRYDDKEKRIIDYLNQYVGTGGKIDLLIFTHNDSDHIGNGDLVLKYFDVKEVWMNGHDATTKVYEKLLDAIAEKDTAYFEPKAGLTKAIGPFELEVFNPTDEAKSNQNDDSIITRVTIGEFSGMFPGDAAKRVEKQLLANGKSLSSTLLHIGHHGSKESSSTDWLAAVNPKVAIYSAGLNNTYHHPNIEAMERINALGIPVYGTDINGTITVSVAKDGSYTVEPTKK